jgi:hypothetical protein
MARTMTNFRVSDMPGISGTADIVDTPDPAPEPQAEQPPAATPQQETTVPETMSADVVPNGTAPEVLAWVNGDKARAQAAYDKEQAQPTPRKGLSNELLEIIQR